MNSPALAFVSNFFEDNCQELVIQLDVPFTDMDYLISDFEDVNSDVGCKYPRVLGSSRATLVKLQLHDGWVEHFTEQLK